MHRVPPIQHWHLRESSIRTMDFKPSPRPPRAEQRHGIEVARNPESLHPQSLRTFYFANAKTDREFGVEDRMQRKGRIDQVSLRKSFYRDVHIFGRH